MNKTLKLGLIVAAAYVVYRQWAMSQRNPALAAHFDEQLTKQSMGKAASNMQMSAQPIITQALGRALTTFNAAVTTPVVRDDGTVVAGKDKTPADDSPPDSGYVTGFGGQDTSYSGTGADFGTGPTGDFSPDPTQWN